MNKSKLIEQLNPLFFEGIAHRGLHNNEYTENGIKAFRNAINNNYAIELDVHLTTDNKLIVCHDFDLIRTTGKNGIIETMDSDFIRNNYKLLDGGNVPLLSEVLELIDERVPLVIELKVYQKNYRELAKVLKEELKNIKDKSKFMIISFDPRSLVFCSKMGIVRQLLICKDHQWVWSLRHLFESVDLDVELLKIKKYQSYHLKHLVNVWTITNIKDLEIAEKYADMVTFQDLDYRTNKEYIK